MSPFPRISPTVGLPLLAAVLLAMGSAFPAEAQTPPVSTPVEGLRDNTPRVHALVDARIVTAPGNVVERGTVVIRNGVVEAVGADVTPPAGARIWEMAGRTVYPAFLDAHAAVGMRTEFDEEEAERGPRHWNPQVRSFVDAAGEFSGDPAASAALRSQGFATALAVPRLGLFRGQAAVVNLGEGAVSRRVLRTGVAQSATLTRDNRVSVGYPTSAMGGITFIRQTFLDTDWYGRAQAAYAADPRGLERPEVNPALAALGPVLSGERPLLFQVADEDEFLRALRFAQEFPLSLWIRGSGHEYRIADRVRAAGVPVILPLAFPSAPRVASEEEALAVELQDLRHWHLAPENPARLAAAGVEFALTADGLSSPDDFLPHLRRAVARGLSPDDALAALTVRPARYLGLERTHGTLEPGKLANLVVADGDLFRSEARILDVWVEGDRFPVADRVAGGRGAGAAGAGGEGDLREGGNGALRDGAEDRSGGATDGGAGGGAGDAHGEPGTALVRLAAGPSPAGVTGSPAAPRPVPAEASLYTDELPPTMPFGRVGLPEAHPHVLVRNATLWTMGSQGILEGADLLVSDGRVAAVGQGLEAPAGATVIDAGGRHVTPGLIDPHIHSGVTGGVNETGSAIVPEVRIGDVLTANHVWPYRQLAGGLTTAHVMHGSANPIGGQNQVVKMRWGGTADEYRFEDARRTVKFALGENVVRRPDRYPDTRMGVEQIIRDHFMAARDHRRAWEAWERTGEGIPPRRDLRLEALLDMMDGEISIQSHSYRQDEILMLIRLAEELGLQIDAFHHGVEAYRVAPELAAHGAAAVVWSDWSSFKIEAYNATTYNVKVLLEAGVLTSLHSDNSEIAGRMNWEAAKMLRTGVTEEEAMALITTAPARVLGIQDRVGSLEVGKDGDFVLWSHHPFSTETMALETWIEGRRYFDREEDRRLRAEVAQERERLIQLAREDR
jgi:imidazolonepropionase-like amidohydrolase